jgi:K+-sensing histidine kinase KdpD
MNPQALSSSDEILERIKQEESQNKRGKLKIFLGYAAGVGKTYALKLPGSVGARQISSPDW